MADLNLSTATDVLKVFYLPPLRRLLNNQTILWNRLERNENYNVEGKNFTVPLHNNRHALALAGRGELGALPDADSQGYANAIVPATFLYTKIQISGPVIRATRSNAGSFIRAVRSEVEGATRDSRKSANRQAHSDGTDPLAFYVSGAGAASGTVDDGKGNAFTFLPAKAVKTDLINGSTHAARQSNVTVTLGDEGVGVFNVTFSPNLDAGATDGDYFTVYGTIGKQMTGLGAIISNQNPPLLGGGLHGITVSGKPWWQAQVVGSDASKQDLRFALMQRVITRIVTASDYTKDDIKFILANPFMVDKYVDLCIQERRAVNVMQLDGGYEGVAFNGIPIVADPEAQRGRMYFIVPETLKIFRMADFSWMDEDGAMLNRVQGLDAYEATLFAYMNLGTVARNGNGVLLGINE